MLKRYMLRTHTLFYIPSSPQPLTTSNAFFPTEDVRVTSLSFACQLPSRSNPGLFLDTGERAKGAVVVQGRPLNRVEERQHRERDTSAR